MFVSFNFHSCIEHSLEYLRELLMCIAFMNLNLNAAAGIKLRRLKLSFYRNFKVIKHFHSLSSFQLYQKQFFARLNIEIMFAGFIRADVLERVCNFFTFLPRKMPTSDGETNARAKDLLNRET